jgi:hypothetical protein
MNEKLPTWGELKIKNIHRPSRAETEAANHTTLPTWYLPAQGYYLCYNAKEDDEFNPRNPKSPTKISTGVYIISDREISMLRHARCTTDYLKSGAQIYRLIHKGTLSVSPLSHYTAKNVTKGELDQLLSARPSWDAIRKSYEWSMQFVGPIWFNFQSPILVF